jgi:Flp pilus assembly secretin CpaC
MPAKLSVQRPCGIILAVIFAAAMSPTQAQEPAVRSVPANPLALPRAEEPAALVVAPSPSETITLRTGMSRAFTVARPFRTIHITNPDIVDAVAQTDQAAILVPKAAGMTNIDILDEKSVRIASVNILVTDDTPGRVVVHNKALLSSATFYRCGVTGCEYVNEITVQEPAPLPKGHTDQLSTNVNTNVNK